MGKLVALNSTKELLKNNSDLNIIYVDVSDLDFVESKTDYFELLYRVKKKLR